LSWKNVSYLGDSNAFTGAAVGNDLVLLVFQNNVYGTKNMTYFELYSTLPHCESGWSIIFDPTRSIFIVYCAPLGLVQTLQSSKDGRSWQWLGGKYYILGVTDFIVTKEGNYITTGWYGLLWCAIQWSADGGHSWIEAYQGPLPGQLYDYFIAVAHDDDNNITVTILLIKDGSNNEYDVYATSDPKISNAWTVTFSFTSSKFPQLIFTEGKFIIYNLDNNFILQSKNGFNWDSIPQRGFYNARIEAVGKFKDNYVACGYNGYMQGSFLTAREDFNWTLSTYQPGNNTNMWYCNGFLQNNGQLFTWMDPGTSDKNIYTTKDLKTWEAIDVSKGQTKINVWSVVDVTEFKKRDGSSTWALIGQTNNGLYIGLSNDLYSWQLYDPKFDVSLYSNYKITNGESLLVLLGYSFQTSYSYVYVSIDGIAWQKIKSSVNLIYDIAIGNNLIVGIFQKYEPKSSVYTPYSLVKSLFSDEWNECLLINNPVFVPIQIDAIIYDEANKVFLVSAFSGLIFSSPDGCNWTPVITGTTQMFWALDIIDGHLIAAGENGITVVSN